MRKWPGTTDQLTHSASARARAWVLGCAACRLRRFGRLHDLGAGVSGPPPRAAHPRRNGAARCGRVLPGARRSGTAVSWSWPGNVAGHLAASLTLTRPAPRPAVPCGAASLSRPQVAPASVRVSAISQLSRRVLIKARRPTPHKNLLKSMSVVRVPAAWHSSGLGRPCALPRPRSFLGGGVPIFPAGLPGAPPPSGPRSFARQSPPCARVSLSSWRGFMCSVSLF